MMIHRCLLLIFTICFTYIAKAQNAGDVLRYTQDNSFGTARNLSLGNSMQALGGDPSAFLSNPAGIGIYRASSLSLSTAIRFNSNSSSYMGQESSLSASSFKLDQLSYVRAQPKNQTYGSLFQGLAFGYNRLADYNNEYTVQGEVTESSFLDYTYDDLIASGIPPEQIATSSLIRLETALAWDVYLLDTLVGGEYFHSNEWLEGKHHKRVKTSGGMNSYYVAYGENYENKLFWGILGEVISINYTENITYSELLPPSTNDRQTDLQEFTFNQNLQTTGSGFKARLGIIYRFSDVFRAGLAYHTPTSFSMTDIWDQRMSSFIDVLGGNRVQSQEFTSSYRLRTPGKMNLSSAIILGKQGLISVSYELIDYSSSRFKETEDGFDFSADNSNISTIYRLNHTVNVGGEYRIQNLTLRGGYRFISDPYTQESNNSAERHMFSIGGGYRNKNFFADLGYRLEIYDENTWLYDSFYVSPAQLNRVNHTLAFTVGLRWK